MAHGCREVAQLWVDAESWPMVHECTKSAHRHEMFLLYAVIKEMDSGRKACTVILFTFTEKIIFRLCIIFIIF